MPSWGGTPQSSINESPDTYSRSEAQAKGVTMPPIPSAPQYVASVQPTEMHGTVEFGHTNQAPGMYCMHTQFEIRNATTYNEGTWSNGTNTQSSSSPNQKVMLIHCWEVPPPSSGSTTSGTSPGNS